MTEQHPLNDEICDSLRRKSVVRNENMRAAADWQLEQVIEYLENDSEFALSIRFWDAFTDKFKKAMRTQQQEDN